MDELEKALPIEENATPEAEATQTSAAPERTEAEAVAAESTAVEETITDVTSAPASEPEDEARARVSYHNMSKEELLQTLRTICTEKQTNMHKEVAVIKQAFYNIRKKEIEKECADYVEAGNDPATFSSNPDEAENEFKDLLAEFRNIRTEYLEAEEARLRANLETRNKILAELNEIAADIDNVNIHFQRFQQLQADFRAISEIPAGAVNDSWKAYQQVAETYYDRLKMNKELRDLDFKKNLEAKRTLIDQAKALSEEKDVVSAFKKLQALHDQWRELGPVARELRESIWEEFKEASTVINKRHQEFFETRKAEEKVNEEAKTALCEEIEKIDFDAIKSFAAWNEHTKVIIDLQNRWKELGFASRKVNNELFARFRKTCDEFFNRKSEFFKQTKAEFAANLERKLALCEKAEALKDNAEGKNVIEEVMNLQAEWKKIGSVPRKHSDAIWERFSKACNHFFDEKKKAMAEQRKEENANLAAKREIIAALKALTAETSEADHEEAVKTVHQLQSKWGTIGHVPYKMKDKLYDEYREAMDKAYEVFDIKKTRARMANFERELKEMEGDDNKLNRERERLQRVLDAKRNDLATYENNMGFFNVKSKSGSGLLKDMERKMARLREEISEVQNKIKMLKSED